MNDEAALRDKLRKIEALFADEKAAAGLSGVAAFLHSLRVSSHLQHSMCWMFGTR
jgi:hypothetical protein